eukprot:XP_016664110.1 PREDICTED: proline-rich protein 12-like [Acyrthosiphon pisum]
MEHNTDDGNVRKGKSVRFIQEPEIFVFESPSNDVDEGNPMTSSPGTRPEQGSVRERIIRYDQNVAWRSIPLHPRPPALPPRNPVQVPVNRTAPKPLPPKPPPRAKNDSTVVRQKVRIFRRCPDIRPVTEGREVALQVPHYRMRVPDTPPPPPPSLVPLVPLVSSATKSTPSTSSTPSAPSVDDDNGICLADPPNTAQADGTTDADSDDDNNRPGCITGCILFIVGCFSCIIG